MSVDNAEAAPGRGSSGGGLEHNEFRIPARVAGVLDALELDLLEVRHEISPDEFLLRVKQRPVARVEIVDHVIDIDAHGQSGAVFRDGAAADIAGLVHGELPGASLPVQ